MSIDINWRPIIGVVLILGAVVAFAGPIVWRWVLEFFEPEPPGIESHSVEPHSSDSPAPCGFTDHVSVILDASQGCPAEIRIGYLIDGLTEAQTLRHEVKRLSPTSEVADE